MSILVSETNDRHLRQDLEIARVAIAETHHSCCMSSIVFISLMFSVKQLACEVIDYRTMKVSMVTHLSFPIITDNLSCTNDVAKVNVRISKLLVGSRRASL